MSAVLKYVQGYPLNIQQSVAELVASKKLGLYLRNKYPEPHQMTSEKSLYDYVMGLKKRYLKQSAPISKVVYDNKLHLVKHALGTHTYVSRVQGNKLKAKQEIRIAGLFKQAPEAMLNMIVVHELAHLKEKEHNKAFYQLCQYMQGDYHQLELDTRLFLTQLELAGPLYK